MNFDPVFAFRMPLRVDLIKPDRRQKQSDTIISSGNADLIFLPEGGTFINGVRQRLSFNAVSSDGKRLKASGKIIKLNEEIITDLNPVAERVIFLNPNSRMNVKISISPEEGRSVRETELTVNTTDGTGENVSSVI